MKLLAYVRSVTARFFDRARIEEDLDEEVRAHLALRADDLERGGLSRADAERRARVEFGGRQRFVEECREALGANVFETLLRDARFSVRVLAKSPAFTCVAVVTLAFAVGANAVVFGILNGLILRPLDVPQADRVYGIEHAAQHSMYESYPDYKDLRDRNHSFEDLAGFDAGQAGLDTGDAATRAWLMEVTGNFFDALHVQPALGRLFHRSDDRGMNGAPYVVISYNYWQTRFHGDPGIVGRGIRLNAHPFTIVGIAPQGFHGILTFFNTDIYVPLVEHEQIDGDNGLDNRARETVFMSLGRLKPRVTPEQAAADLDSIGAYLEKTYPTQHGATSFRLARPGLYGNYLGQPMKAFLTGLMVLAALILLAACANLGSLFAARASDRSREVALRLALGAGRGRILRQLLTEALPIALLGGAGGLWGSVLLLRVLTAWQPFPRYPISVPVAPDAKVYLLAVLLALISGLLFGLVPARQVLRTDPYQIIKAGPARHVWRRLTLRDLLLVSQVAICAVLVTASIVAVRGLARSLNSRFGFDPRNALVADTDFAMASYAADRVPAMQKRLVESVAAVPGVESVGMVGRPPLGAGSFDVLVFKDDTADFRPSSAAATAMRYNVSPEYFHAARTSLVAGRAFSWHDDLEAPFVAVVNRTFAARLFGSPAQALGGFVKLRTGRRLQIVGVVEDGKYMTLTEDPMPALFLPIVQAPMSETWLIVRSDRDPAQLADGVRLAVRRLDPALPLYVEEWSRQLEFALFPSRIATLALGVMGLIGALLSITGIFGMAAYSVSRRLRELGIRIALGAQTGDVLNAAVGRAFKLLAAGSAAGLLLGLLAARVLAAIVYQATPRDPLVLGGSVAVMLSLGLLATWVPARRALSADPLALLREE
jgi:predicted permease